MATIVPEDFPGLKQITPQIYPPPGGYLQPSGTQFAAWPATPGFPIPGTGRPVRSKMIAKIVLVGAALLAITPAVATAFWPASPEQATLRDVDLNGPILGFTQSRDRIQVRLASDKIAKSKADYKQVTVRDQDGDVIAIPLKDGQTWATAQLPANIADATKLEISVE